jgi:hypothetical protein
MARLKKNVFFSGIILFEDLFGRNIVERELFV